MKNAPLNTRKILSSYHPSGFVYVNRWGRVVEVSSKEVSWSGTKKFQERT